MPNQEQMRIRPPNFTEEPKTLAMLLRYALSNRVSVTSWEESASLALFGHPSSDGVTIKMPYEVDVLHQPISLKLNLALFLDQLRLA